MLTYEICPKRLFYSRKYFICQSGIRLLVSLYYIYKQPKENRGKKKYRTMRCYVCNREMIDKPTDMSLCKAHGEHILHNGIRGKLISRTILCEECGGSYSKDDANFCKIFAPFIVALSDRMIPADHGKTDGITLKGSIVKTPDIKECDESIEVTAKNGEVIPIQPFYTIDGKKIDVYAGKKRIKDYINVLAKELKDNGDDIDNYTVEKHPDMHDRDYLAYYFSKGNDNFNMDFKKGMVKIATEYALHCGIAREALTEVISIDHKGKAIIDYDKAKLIPFFPTTLFDILFEYHRYLFEDGYPSHVLKLFTTKYNDGKTRLYCYLDLFSTFQYYVLLNDDYKGEEISETYAQRLIPKRQHLDVRYCRPKDLSIAIQEYKIDKSRLQGKSYEEQVKYVQTCIDKYPLQTYDLQAALESAVEKINMVVMAYFVKLMKTSAPELSTVLLSTGELNNIPASINSILDTYCKGARITDLIKLNQVFPESIKTEYYRKCGFEIIEDEIRIYSHPDESMNFLHKNEAAAKEYTNAKFSHLNCLCYEPSKLK